MPRLFCFGFNLSFILTILLGVTIGLFCRLESPGCANVFANTNSSYNNPNASERFRNEERIKWDDPTTIEFMDFLKQKLLRKMRETDPNVEWKPEHWYQVRKADIRQAGGVGLLFKYGNSASALIMALTPSPQAGWNHKRFRTRKSCKTTLRSWNSDSTESSPAEGVDPSPQRSFAP
jgi:hypothetical protein